jgi:hypothetical protein
MKIKNWIVVFCVSLSSAPLLAAGHSSAAGAPADVTALRDQIAAQQAEIQKLENALAAQAALLDHLAPATPIRSAATAPAVARPVSVAVVPAVDGNAWQHPESKPSPLSVPIGNTTFTPLGFVDATFYGRSTNVGSGIGTNFGGIPFSNSSAGHLSEANFSDQNSRIGFRVDSTVHGANVLGYFEADFLGNQPGNVYVTSNSDTFRMRNVFVDVRKGIFEVLGGQDWSLATPNRVGLSPVPSDIFYTQNMDTNYQLGLVWSRQTQARFVLHPTDNFAFGLSLENPQQYIGGSGGLSAAAVTLPSALSTALSSEFNNGATNFAAPNLHPDIIAKAAYDLHAGGKLLHFEAVSLTRSFKDAFGSGAPATFQANTLTTESGELNANLQVVKRVRLIANTFFGSGNGRYVFGLAPDVIVRPNGTLSPVHTYSTVDGFEAQISRSTLLYSYYGGIDVGRNVAIDTNGKPVGYGFFGSTNGDNRTMQEATIGLVPTIWKSEGYGALSMILQYSYLTRAPWYVAPGAPDKAHTDMYWVDLRYTLP